MVNGIAAASASNEKMRRMTQQLGESSEQADAEGQAKNEDESSPFLALPNAAPSRPASRPASVLDRTTTVEVEKSLKSGFQ